MKKVTECLDGMELGNHRFRDKRTAAACLATAWLRNNHGEKGMEGHPPRNDQCQGCQRLEKYLALTAPEDVRGNHPVSMEQARIWAGRMDRYMLFATAEDNRGPQLQA